MDCGCRLSRRQPLHLVAQSPPYTGEEGGAQIGAAKVADCHAWGLTFSCVELFFANNSWVR